MQRVRIIGSPLSPYVRKVLVVLGLKQLEYEIDPLVPFFGDERFARLSPLRRIPVLIDDRATLVDSSVICQYLEDRHPEPQVYPDDLVARAEARWLEEFADTRLADVVIWGLFNELAIGRSLPRRATSSFRRSSISSKSGFQLVDSCTGSRPSPTFRSRASSATRSSCATQWTPRAGRAPLRSSNASSRSLHSWRCEPSRNRFCGFLRRSIESGSRSSGCR